MQDAQSSGKEGCGGEPGKVVAFGYQGLRLPLEGYGRGSDAPLSDGGQDPFPQSSSLRGDVCGSTELPAVCVLTWPFLHAFTPGVFLALQGHQSHWTSVNLSYHVKGTVLK